MDAPDRGLVGANTGDDDHAHDLVVGERGERRQQRARLGLPSVTTATPSSILVETTSEPAMIDPSWCGAQASSR